MTITGSSLTDDACAGAHQGESTAACYEIVMKRPADNEPEPEGGRAAERLREFQRQRHLPDASPEDTQKEAERRKKEEAERSQSPTEAGQEPAPPREQDPGSGKPE